MDEAKTQRLASRRAELRRRIRSLHAQMWTPEAEGFEREYRAEIEKINRAFAKAASKTQPNKTLKKEI